MLPDFERADRIGEFWGPGDSRLRRAAHRLRGGPYAAGGVGRRAARGRTLGSLLGTPNRESPRRTAGRAMGNGWLGFSRSFASWTSHSWSVSNPS
jgi:hypothetical protein